MNFFNGIITYENLLQTLRIWYYNNILIFWIIWAGIILGGTTEKVKKISWLAKLVFRHSFHLTTGKKLLERSFGRSIQSYSLQSFFSRKMAMHVLILNWLKSTPFPLDISKCPSNSAVVFKVILNNSSLQNCSNNFLAVPDCSYTANSNLKKKLVVN